MSPAIARPGETTNGTSEIARRAAAPPCTGPVDARACTCGACSCSWCWSACWWRCCTSSCGRDAQQPGPQRPDLLRAGRRHPLRLPAGGCASTPRSAGSTPSASPIRGLPSRIGPCCWRRWPPCCATAPASLSLSATSMRSIMDSIGSRLDEARDTGRYLVGLLVFLGLLGTFWGLLDTIQSVGKTIGASTPGPPTASPCSTN